MMKRLLLTALVLTLMLMLSGSSALAQGESYFGFKGGMSMANFSGDDAEGLDARTGFGAGVFFTKMV
ncbi:MAG: PorT family protein, partial [Proteobacteria bacterium]|nr:PorT family protein [Pseudomonadota bacterium]